MHLLPMMSRVHFVYSGEACCNEPQPCFVERLHPQQTVHSATALVVMLLMALIQL